MKVEGVWSVLELRAVPGLVKIERETGQRGPKGGQRSDECEEERDERRERNLVQECDASETKARNEETKSA